MINAPSSIFSALSSSNAKAFDQAYEADSTDGLLSRFNTSFFRLRDSFNDTQQDRFESYDQSVIGNKQVWAFIEDPFSLLYRADANVQSYSAKNAGFLNPIPPPTVTVQDAVLLVLTTTTNSQILRAEGTIREIDAKNQELKIEIEKYREKRDELVRLQNEAEASDNPNFFEKLGNFITGVVLPVDLILYGKDPWSALKSALPIFAAFESLGASIAAFIRGDIETAIANLVESGYHLSQTVFLVLEVISRGFFIGLKGLSELTGLKILDLRRLATETFFNLTIGIAGTVNPDAAVNAYEHLKEHITDKKLHAVFQAYYAKQTEALTKRTEALKTRINVQIKENQKILSEIFTNLERANQFTFEVIDEYYSSLRDRLASLAA